MSEQINVFTPQQWRAMTVPGVYTTGHPPTDWQSEQLLQWKQKIIDYQREQTQILYHQTDLFAPATTPPLLNPLALAAQGGHWFRMARELAPNEPCIYFILDRAAPLILYIGETVHLRRRWQGHHDGKTYLSYYLDSHRRHQLPTQIHWVWVWHVPRATRLRQQWERQLIHHWLPPFNKESWGRWGADTFTLNTTEHHCSTVQL